MSDYLQDLFFDKEHTIKSVSLEYIFTSDVLVPEVLSNDLGIQPAKAWKKGEEYEGKFFDQKNKRVSTRLSSRYTGVWMIETKAIESLNIEDHFSSILEILEPKQTILQKYLIDTQNYYIRFYAWSEFYAEHGCYKVNSNLLKVASKYSHDIEFCFNSNAPPQY